MEEVISQRAEAKADKANRVNAADKYKPRHNFSGYLKKSTWVTHKPEAEEHKPEKYDAGRKNIYWKNHCLLMGYSGDNYCGMQYNPNVPTIENELFNAMLRQKWITEENKVKPWTIAFQRGSRTDTGVSAVRQVCSLWLREYLQSLLRAL